jgi:hypothetical protein
VGDRPTLFFGHDDFISPEMEFGRLANPTLDGIRALPSFITGEYTTGELLDWDDFVAIELDRFDFVLAPDGRYRSEAPPNFRRVAGAGGYDLYEREGKTPPRRSVDDLVAPGHTLDCDSPAGRRIARRNGEAAVMPAPVTFGGLGRIAPGDSLAVTMQLPPGRWDLSLAYVSPLGVRAASDGIDKRLPAYLARSGPYFDLGTVTSRGLNRPIPITFSAERPSPLTVDQSAANLGELVATRPGARRIVPLAEACDRYVDWFRFRPPTPQPVPPDGA